MTTMKHMYALTPEQQARVPTVPISAANGDMMWWAFRHTDGPFWAFLLWRIVRGAIVWSTAVVWGPCLIVLGIIASTLLVIHEAWTTMTSKWTGPVSTR